MSDNLSPYNTSTAIPADTADTARTAGKRRPKDNLANLPQEFPSEVVAPEVVAASKTQRGLLGIPKPLRPTAATAVPAAVPAAVPTAVPAAVPAASNAAASTSNAESIIKVKDVSDNNIVLPKEGEVEFDEVGLPVYISPEYPHPADDLRKAVLRRRETGQKLVFDLYRFRTQLKAYNAQVLARGSIKNERMFGGIAKDIFELYKVAKKSRNIHSDSVKEVVKILGPDAGVSQAEQIVETPVTFLGIVTPFSKPEVKEFSLYFEDNEEKKVNELVKKYPGEAALVGLKAGISKPILPRDATLGGTRSRSRSHTRKLSQRNKRKYTTCRNRKNHKNRKNRKN